MLHGAGRADRGRIEAAVDYFAVAQKCGVLFCGELVRFHSPTVHPKGSHDPLRHCCPPTFWGQMVDLVSYGRAGNAAKAIADLCANAGGCCALSWRSQR